MSRWAKSAVHVLLVVGVVAAASSCPEPFAGESASPIPVPGHPRLGVLFANPCQHRLIVALFDARPGRYSPSTGSVAVPAHSEHFAPEAFFGRGPFFIRLSPGGSLVEVPLGVGWSYDPQVARTTNRVVLPERGCG